MELAYCVDTAVVDKNNLTQEKLMELIDYDPETGIFTWKANRIGPTKPGKIAGGIDPEGYRQIRIFNQGYRAHRLAFLYMEGYLPENQVDHINRERDDNRWCNLREVSGQCNMRNRKNQHNNKCGVKGIHWRKNKKSWRAQISIFSKTYTLGQFKDFDEAVAHRLAAEQCLNWSGCEEDSPACLYIKNLFGRI